MDLRYPIGKFQAPGSVTPSLRARWIDDIAAAPARLRAAVQGLDDAQLDTPYRPGGWTVRQVIHHVPDSHMNSYIRFRLALTEDEPAIKPYDEVKWAELHDASTAPVGVSLQLLEALHVRWVVLLRSLSETDFSRRFNHPEDGVQRLDTALAAYAWHGKHHAAHISGLCERMGWK
jgi:DinB family protein